MRFPRFIPLTYRIWAVLALVLSCSEAWAQGPAQSAYERELSLAIAAHRQGRWDEAHAHFARAHELYPNARSLRGLGVSAFEANRFPLAARDLEAALTHPEKRLDGELRRAVEVLLEEARARIGRYEISVDPGTAVVLIDGAPAIRAANGEVLVTPGEHALHIEAEGHVAAEMTLHTLAAERQNLRVVLAHIPSEPQAPLVAAGAIQAVEPAQPVTRSSQGPVRAPSAAQTRNHTAPVATSRMRPSLLIGAAASTVLAVTALGTAAGLYAVAQERVASVGAICRGQPAGACSQEEADALVAARHIERLERSTNAMIGVAAVMAVAGVVLWTLAARSRAHPAKARQAGIFALQF